jgi:hypothetical protein
MAMRRCARGSGVIGHSLQAMGDDLRARPTHDLASPGIGWPDRWGAGNVKNCKRKVVLRERIELSASPLPRECSTTELPQLSQKRFKDSAARAYVA